MKNFNDAVRMYLINKGFNSNSLNGDNYILWYNGCQKPIKFEVFLASCKASATYPDKEYNARNPYSTKDCKVDFSWANDDDEDNDTIIHNLDKFFDKIIELNK